MQKTIQKLADKNGQEEVLKAAEQVLMNSIQKKVPTEYERLIQPKEIELVKSTIDDAILDLAAAGREVDESYSDKGDLLKKISQLRTAIQIKEAEAIMTLGGEQAVIDGKTARVKTGAEQDMYRRYMSREERTELSKLEGELQAIDVDIHKARALRDDAKVTSDLVIAKAYVQANLLKILS